LPGLKGLFGLTVLQELLFGLWDGLRLLGEPLILPPLPGGIIEVRVLPVGKGAQTTNTSKSRCYPGQVPFDLT
jgi:hypothetical protein